MAPAGRLDLGGGVMDRDQRLRRYWIAVAVLVGMFVLNAVLMVALSLRLSR